MSYKLNITETWDSLPITKEKPYGITIVTFRRDESLTEYLVLHRVHRKKSSGNRWAWGPPAGARLPQEDVYECACRELEEETGIKGFPQETNFPVKEWKVYYLEVDYDISISLSEEHDDYKWVDINTVEKICLPRLVFEQVDFVRKLKNL